MNQTVISFRVFVGGQPLDEYIVDDKSYIEADLHSSSSYIIEDYDDEGYLQQYPVTPFEVRGVFENRLKTPCYLKLCVDGQKVWMKPFAPSNSKQHFKVHGIKDHRNGFSKELLFSLPKITSQKNSKSKGWTEDLGTISIECIEAFDDGEHQTYQRVFDPVTKDLMTSETQHKQATKQDCQGVGMTTREGKALFTQRTTNRIITMRRYKLGYKSYGKLMLYYRPRIVLQEMGIVNDKWDSPVKSNVSSPDSSGDKENQREGGSLNVGKRSSQKSSKVLSDRQTEPLNGNVYDLNAKSIKKEITDKENNQESSTLTNAVKNEAVTSIPVTKAVKQELITDKRVENVINQLAELTTDNRKLYCYSPSAVKIKKEMIRTSLSTDLNQNMVNGKLGCYTPTSSKGDNGNFLNPCQIKKELFDGDEKKYRYMEIDDDLIMLQEVDDDVVWMGDDSCCFIDIDPVEEPMIHLD